MAPQPQNQDGPRQDAPRAGVGTAPKSNPINMALAELQGDFTETEAGPSGEPGSRGASAATLAAPPEAARDQVPRAPQGHASGNPNPAATRTTTTVVDPPSASGSANVPPYSSSTAPGPGEPNAARRDLPRDRAPALPPLASAPRTGTGISPEMLLGSSAALALLFGWFGAWGYEHSMWRPRRDGDAGKPAQATGAPDPVGFEYLKDQVEDLRGRVDEVKKQVAEAPRPQVAEAPRPVPSRDVSDLRARVDELARSTAQLAPLTGQIKGTEGRIDSLEKSVKSLGDELAALRASLAKKDDKPARPAESANGPGPVPVPSEADRREIARPIVEDVHPADEALAEGVDLYKQRKFKEAYNVFSKLEETHPDDARVWYYAALSNGYATNEWKGETLRLVQKGMDREQAGTPSTDRIDAAFQGLSKELGKGWLEYYRNRVKR